MLLVGYSHRNQSMRHEGRIGRQEVLCWSSNRAYQEVFARLSSIQSADPNLSPPFCHQDRLAVEFCKSDVSLFLDGQSSRDPVLSGQRVE